MCIKNLRKFPGGLAVKDPALSLPWLRSRNFLMTQAQPKKKKKKKKNVGSSRGGAVVNESD